MRGNAHACYLSRTNTGATVPICSCGWIGPACRAEVGIAHVPMTDTDIHAMANLRARKAYDAHVTEDTQRRRDAYPAATLNALTNRRRFSQP